MPPVLRPSVRPSRSLCAGRGRDLSASRPPDTDPNGPPDTVEAAECRGYGRQKGQLEQYQGTEYHIDFLPKVLLTGIIADADADRVIELVCATARTGRIGDGKIFLQAITSTVD